VGPIVGLAGAKNFVPTQIRSRRQRTDIGKYSFVNRSIQHWNQLPAEVLGTLLCKPVTFKKRARKVIIELN
jgi:hypothetical protein